MQQEQQGQQEQQEQQEQEYKFDIASINEFLGTEFEEAGSLKETWTKNTELNSKFESLSNEKSGLESKYSELEGKYNNVINYFSGDDVIKNLYGSEDVWKRVQLSNKFEGKDPSVVSQVYNSDLNSFKDEDVILMADKLALGNIGLSDSERKEAILESILGVDVDLTDLDAKQKYKLSKAASEARKELSEIKNYDPGEPQFDWLGEAKQASSALAEKRKNSLDAWTKAVNEKLPSFEGVKLTAKDGDKDVEIFSYEADDDFKKNIAPNVIKDFVDQGLDVSNEQSQKLLDDYLNNAFKAMYFEKAIKKAIEQASVSAQDSAHNDMHNDQDPNDKQAPQRQNGSNTMSLVDYMRRKIKK